LNFRLNVIMNRLKVLAIVPDSIETPSGGLGEQFRHLQQHLSDKVEYFICGYPENNKIKNYKGTTAPIEGFYHQALTTIYGQSMYFFDSLQFNTRFDIVHACDWSSFYAGVLISKHFNIPLVCTVNLSLKQLNTNGIFYCQDYSSVDGKNINDLQVKFEEFGLKHASKIIHVSNYYKNSFNDSELESKSVVIHNGVEINEWKPKTAPQLPGKNKIKLCYIGRASVTKGLSLILKCNIPEDIDFYFIVSDKNAEEPFYSEIKRKANNKNIFHINGLYGQEKIDMLFAMDGVVMPSIHEPFGIVALEALISQNTLFTTAVDGIAEIVDGIPHLPITDSASLLTQINFFKKCSKELRQEAINKGVERAKMFSWSVQSQKVLDVYKELVY